MAIRFPKACTKFSQFTDTNLATYAQKIHDGLLAAIADFPTPPVLPATLQPQINAYVAALTLAIGPGAGKINTANKNYTKQILLISLRTNVNYVNQIVAANILAGNSYDAQQPLILSSGYELSEDPTPAGPLPPVSIKRYGSYTSGQFYILAIRVPNAKGYAVRVANNSTVEPVKEFTFPNTRMTFTGLNSGDDYTFSIAAIGANPLRNFATQITGQIII